MTGAGAGTVDRQAPDGTLLGTAKHFLHDVAPFLLCCKAGEYSDCDKYQDHRPSDNGSRYNPPPPGKGLYAFVYVSV